MNIYICIPNLGDTEMRLIKELCPYSMIISLWRYKSISFLCLIHRWCGSWKQAGWFTYSFFLGRSHDWDFESWTMVQFQFRLSIALHHCCFHVIMMHKTNRVKWRSALRIPSSCYENFLHAFWTKLTMQTKTGQNLTVSYSVGIFSPSPLCRALTPKNLGRLLITNGFKPIYE